MNKLYKLRNGIIVKPYEDSMFNNGSKYPSHIRLIVVPEHCQVVDTLNRFDVRFYKDMTICLQSTGPEAKPKGGFFGPGFDMVEEILPSRESLSPQQQTILDHCETTGSISNVEANAIHKIRCVAKRISELKSLGFNFIGKWRKDVTGQKYKRYFLLQEDGALGEALGETV